MVNNEKNYSMAPLKLIEKMTSEAAVKEKDYGTLKSKAMNSGSKPLYLNTRNCEN